MNSGIIEQRSRFVVIGCIFAGRKNIPYGRKE